jgi:hypothetical protein
MLPRCIIVGGILLASASSALAQGKVFRPAGSPPPSEPLRIHLFAELGFATVGLDPGAAGREGIGSRASGFFLGGGARYGILSLGAGFSGLFAHDDSSFSESTTGGERSSSLMVFDYAIQAELRLLPLRGAYPAAELSVRGGIGGFGGSRSIDNCVDCTSEKIHLAGGPFVAPTVAIRIIGRGTARGRMDPRAGYLVVSYRYYTQGSEGDHLLLILLRASM